MKTFWIAKVFSDTFGHKKKVRYLKDSFSESEFEAHALAQFLAGFADYEIVALHEYPRSKHSSPRRKINRVRKPIRKSRSRLGGGKGKV